MRWIRVLVLLTFGFATIGLSASAQVEIASLRVDTSPTQNVKELVDKSTLIVLAWPDSADEEHPTNQTVEQYKIVNYVQTLHVKQTMKGSASPLIRVLTTGTDPLPEAGNPLNKIYPGPLAEGDYVCFLKKVPGADLYTIIGGWQGVYPFQEGRTVTLQGFGYSDFNGLNEKQMQQKIKQLEQ